MRKWLKQYLPTPELLNKKLGHYPRLARALTDPNLWRLNRRSASRGVAVGLFITFVPIPLQLLLSALAAIVFRANLPIALILSMINNPLTFVPINYYIYKAGQWILLRDFHENGFVSFSWDLTTLHSAWHSFIIWLPQFGKAYFLGLTIISFGSALLGYIIIDIAWRFDVYIRLYFRKKKKMKKM